MKSSDVPITNMTALKKSPMQVIKKAEQSKQGVYILNHDTPVAIILKPKDYENLIHKIAELKEKLLDTEVEKVAIARIKNGPQKVYSEKEVLGLNGLDDVELDKDDGWE